MHYDVKVEDLYKLHKDYSNRVLERETKKIYGKDYNDSLKNTLFNADSEFYLYPERVAMDVIERYIHMNYEESGKNE